MRYRRNSPNDPRIREALAELQNLILDRYPDASFTVSEGDDPTGVYLRATVDVEDLDEVLDVVIDRLLDLQIRERLPVYVIPVRPLERTVAELRRAKSQA